MVSMTLPQYDGMVLCGGCGIPPVQKRSGTYASIHQKQIGDEGRAASRKHGVKVRVGDRRRPDMVSDVTNPSKRHILPMKLGKELRRERKNYTAMHRGEFFFLYPFTSKCREAPGWRRQEAIGNNGSCNSASS